jgi:hypothetical protein
VLKCCILIFAVLLISTDIWSSRPDVFEKIDSALLGFSVYFPSFLFLEKAKKTLSFLENAFNRQVIEQGFTSPVSYQIYLAPTATGGAYTHHDALGIYTVMDLNIDVLLLETYVHHEWQHACQYAMGGPSSSLWMDEASAVLQEILLAPSAPYWLDGLKDFQSNPQESLFGFGAHSDKYIYGGALFLLFLEEEHGSKNGHLVRQLWQKGEPWKDALEEVTKLSLSNLVLDFALWRIKAGSLYGDQGILKTRRLLKINNGALVLHAEEMPNQLGCFFVQHYAKKNSVLFQINIKSLLPLESKRPLGFAWQISKKSKIAVPMDFHSSQNNLTVNLQENEEITVAICDLSEHLAFKKPIAHPIEVFLQKL